MPSGIGDFLFGKGALKKAENPTAPATTSQPAEPGISMDQIRRDAQAQADRDLKANRNASIPDAHSSVKNPATHADKLEHN